MIGENDLAQQFSAADPFCVLGSFSNGVEVYGHLIEATESVSIYTGEPEAHDVSFECRTDETTTVINEMTVVIDGTTYTVKRKQRLGTGVSLVYLKT